MARFQIATPILFVPPNPAKTYDAVQPSPMPSFGNFFVQYFAGTQYDLKAPKANSFLQGMRRCFESNPANPVDQCQYYIEGFKRTAVAN